MWIINRCAAVHIGDICDSRYVSVIASSEWTSSGYYRNVRMRIAADHNFEHAHFYDTCQGPPTQVTKVGRADSDGG